MKASSRDTGDPPLSVPVRAMLAFGRVYARGFHSLRLANRNPLPKAGPAILVCNHISGVDPVLIQSTSARLLVWMVAKEYYEISAIKPGFEMIEAIPVARSGRDFASTRAALRALESGRILGVFPEGRIEADRQLLPFHSGVAMMAERTGVDVYPAYLDGDQRGTTMTEALSRRHSAILAFGPPIRHQTSDNPGHSEPDLEAATARIRAGVEALRQLVSSLQPKYSRGVS